MKARTPSQEPCPPARTRRIARAEPAERKCLRSEATNCRSEATLTRRNPAQAPWHTDCSPFSAGYTATDPLSGARNHGQPVEQVFRVRKLFSRKQQLFAQPVGQQSRTRRKPERRTQQQRKQQEQQQRARFVLQQPQTQRRWLEHSQGVILARRPKPAARFEPPAYSCSRHWCWVVATGSPVRASRRRKIPLRARCHRVPQRNRSPRRPLQRLPRMRRPRLSRTGCSRPASGRASLPIPA